MLHQQSPNNSQYESSLHAFQFDSSLFEEPFESAGSLNPLRMLLEKLI